MSEISDARLAELIAMNKVDADSYERQGDESALRWAKASRDDEMALRELQSARQRSVGTVPYEDYAAVGRELRIANQRIAALTEALALTRTVLVVACGDAPYIRVALERIDRVLPGSATKESV